ncbi:hypothetical protein B0T11DRAFT_332005 [Plectosphaerella cucumerina]|uniref:Ecp2 effector protein-like domain-containing protein n=1 Tax=Plectosphaerella cucumerina TaxID=40658 RepID=A0A8K0TBX2_9PEZI|nr:hypothetical protein B0T11DRAFT_332005 [Plectosphaerella cucumerina]
MLSFTILKAAALALAAVSSAMPTTGTDDAKSPDCCAGLTAPFDGAICHPFIPAAGKKCAPIWVNDALIRRDEEAPVTPAINRRLEFFRLPTGQLICDDGKNTEKCLDRGRDAVADDCALLSSFWESRDRTGYWIINARDLAGQSWLRLVQHASCTFAVGNRNDKIGNEIRLGNLDLAAAVNNGVYSCGPLNPNIES